MAAPAVAHALTGPPDGPVTLVLHGGGPGCHSASDFAGVLALRRDRRHLVVDLPRYGASGALDDDGPAFTGYAGVLAGLLDRLGVGEVDVLAQSLGGSVALRLAADEPHRVRRMLVIGSAPVPGADAGLGARVRADYYGGTGPDPEKMRRLIADLEWHDGDAVPEATVQARYRASTTPVALATATGGRGAPEDLTDALPRVAAPTLVVRGRHDPFAPTSYAAALVDALPAGDLAVLGRTAHHPQAERPDAVARLAASFLDPDPRS
ncbi:alpha/beta fold hydrolase [Pseudonocardia broussonetiae]|uniref:Alpha/beta hydrolase n=1 Tax=Pseudonocardia broussonetiae TaxID=2736640 RepID=A0A6M6JPK6_9PSEU|nr:alpha/beta hydrolase [Pseudonocardia broussonetiae]QJY48231.1 alpha/beta hydrolase [Pseudonocardia broussonetiae]